MYQFLRDATDDELLMLHTQIKRDIKAYELRGGFVTIAQTEDYWRMKRELRAVRGEQKNRRLTAQMRLPLF